MEWDSDVEERDLNNFCARAMKVDVRQGSVKEQGWFQRIASMPE
jgi:hypothetical protein